MKKKVEERAALKDQMLEWAAKRYPRMRVLLADTPGDSCTLALGMTFEILFMTQLIDLLDTCGSALEAAERKVDARMRKQAEELEKVPLKKKRAPRKKKGV